MVTEVLASMSICDGYSRLSFVHRCHQEVDLRLSIMKKEHKRF
uniref:Uncharacterized protein n=1 Tax=Rhizophora mucronata TaxID=61149 RepID=A0A2P2J2F2_RHIMU